MGSPHAQYSTSDLSALKENSNLETISNSSYLLPVVAWIAYCLVHSLLASLAVKQWLDQKWPGGKRAYRLVYNLLAVILLIPVLSLTRQLDHDFLWQWKGAWKLIGDSFAGLAILGFVWTLRYYDMMEFLGFRQLKQKVQTVMDQENFMISPLHRVVRHPWYFLILVILWTRDITPSGLLLNVVVTLYFIIGSRLEENKLKEYHGDLYLNYKKQVPALFPLPWRFLSQKDAKKFLSSKTNF